MADPILLYLVRTSNKSDAESLLQCFLFIKSLPLQSDIHGGILHPKIIVLWIFLLLGEPNMVTGCITLEHEKIVSLKNTPLILTDATWLTVKYNAAPTLLLQKYVKLYSLLQLSNS